LFVILTSHPIQYQAPLWRALHEADFAPLKVWFLSDHGLRESQDLEFGRSFAWDLDLLTGYPHEFLPVEAGVDLRKFRGIRLQHSFGELLERGGVTDIWVEGWRLKPMWDAVREAKWRGVRVWLRGESNDLKRDPWWKRSIKRTVLGRHLRQVDHLLCIGRANRRLYRSYGVAEDRLLSAPYPVDNDRFFQNATSARASRDAIRRDWGVPKDAWCVLFCGKFIAKKRPADLVAAVRRLGARTADGRPIHLLFVGSGELGHSLRAMCRVAFDVEGQHANVRLNESLPQASFVGFLNQSEIARAYASADLLVLPSDAGETWGLVVNEAMAAGCPAVVSDQSGCAEDLPALLDPRLVFRCGDVEDLADALAHTQTADYTIDHVKSVVDLHHLRYTVATVSRRYAENVGTLTADRLGGKTLDGIVGGCAIEGT
jgi:glycosyltransferase involved in cell wall biosynthesis